MSLIQSVLDNLAQLGFYDFFMPFVLILAVVFGILQNKKTISEEVSVNGAIAIAIAFLATYTLRGVFFTQIFGIAGTIIAAIVILIIFLALFGVKPEEVFGGDTKYIAGIGAVIIVAIAYMLASGTTASISSETVMTIIVLLVTFGAVYLIAKK